MPPNGDYFVRLGLAPGVYSERQLADRLADIRRRQPGQDRLADATMAFCVLRDPERQRRYLARLLVGATGEGDARAAPGASGQAGPPDAQPRPAGDLEDAFSAGVAGLLEGDSGVLRYSNRMRLLDLAARLGIRPFEANLLIERARFRATHRPAWAADPRDDPRDWPPDVEAGLPPDAPDRPGDRSTSRAARWLIAIGLALLADAVLLAVLLRG